MIGFLASRARKGHDGEKVLFLVNMLLLWLAPFWMFGYPGLMVPAPGLAASCLLLKVILTSGDVFTSNRRIPGS